MRAVTPDAEAKQTARLTAWSRRHALIMVAACAGAVLYQRAWLVPLAAMITVAGLVSAHRGRYTARGGFGAANAITAARLAITLAVGLAPPVTPGPWLAAGLGAAWSLDGLDGAIARRAGLSSAFGATFDVEADALLVLIADVQLWHRDRFGAWVLISGLLRYGYVLALAIHPPPAGHVPRSRLGRAAFVALAIGLTAAFASEGPTATALAVLGSTAVGISFAYSFLWSYGRRG